MGCAIFASTSDAEGKMTVENCLFSYNKPTQLSIGYYGCVVAYSNAIEFTGENVFENNEIDSGNDSSKEEKMSYGGSLTILQNKPNTYTVLCLNIRNSYSKHFGGAIGIKDSSKKNLFVKDDNESAQLFIDIANCTFENFSATNG